MRKGLPFRSAYKISGRIVSECLKKDTVLEELPIEEYKKHSELFDIDLYDEISLETCVDKRISEGGTSVNSVEMQIQYIKDKYNFNYINNAEGLLQRGACSIFAEQSADTGQNSIGFSRPCRQGFELI